MRTPGTFLQYRRELARWRRREAQSGADLADRMFRSARAELRLSTRGTRMAREALEHATRVFEQREQARLNAVENFRVAYLAACVALDRVDDAYNNSGSELSS